MLLGSQQPRFLTGPDGVSSAGQEAVELAASAGLILDEGQQLALDRMLREEIPGEKWAASEAALIEPRQNGKGSVLEALELAHLNLFATELILHSAHLFKTSSEAFRRLLNLVKANPDIERRILKVYATHGSEGIEFRGGQRIQFVARSSGGGRGLGGGLVVMDEAYRLFAAAMEALVPTMSAQKNPQIVYASSGPVPGEESDVLRKLIRRGRAGTSPRLAYLEWSAPGLDDSATDEEREAYRRDRRVWAIANPGLGIRITEDAILTELETLEPEGFDRERLGIFPAEEDADAVIDTEKWAAQHNSKAGPLEPFGFAFDVSVGGRSAAFGMAGGSKSGRLHLEVIEHRSGTGWVVARAKSLQERWGKPFAIAAGSPAMALTRKLEEAGVEFVVVSTADHASACGALQIAVAEDCVQHLGQVPLDVAVEGASARDAQDGWLWSRRKSSVDICPLVAVTLAAHMHSQAPAPDLVFAY